MAIFTTGRAFAIVFIIIAAYFAANDPAVERARAREAIRRAPVAYVPPATQCTTTGHLALTFNNGVSLNNTPVLLDVLKSAKVPATFFVSTEWVGVYPGVDALLRRMVAEGHVLGFSWFGTDPRNLTATALRAQLVQQSAMVYNAAGVHPRFMRFPFDQLNQAVAGVANDLGLVLSLWNIDPADYNLCNSVPNYTTANVTNAYKEQFDLFAGAGNLQSRFIGVSQDLCPVGPAMGAVIELVKQYKYSLVDIATCLSAGARYRAADDAPATYVEPGATASVSSSTPGAVAGSSTLTKSSTSTATAKGTNMPIQTGNAATKTAGGPSVLGLAMVLVAVLLVHVI
ncbi:hypothetical protein BC828DRAFT_403168 [Blastocladiella britannica]|nr:hypothetical protein BC828DRAFT_403168 [Blastocladiella britannica]